MMLLPADVREWLPPGHLVYFIMDVVDTLDLSAILGTYDGSRGGQPAYHPAMMARLLVYAYCMGIPSSRKIEKSTHESIPFRILSDGAHPDHDTIAEFRRRHLKALSGLFAQVLELCREAGLVKMGRVSLDGTKMRANASKHKAMSYDRMVEKEKALEQEVAALMAAAEAVDTQEDTLHGRGRRGDELPKELQFRASRLKKIREAKAVLDQRAREAAEAERKQQAAVAEAQRAARDPVQTGMAKPRRGPAPQPPSETPDAKAQYNFTDPESRIMKDGATGSFAQCYNCQIAVDEAAQVIVATQVTQQANDKQQIEPVVENLKQHSGGETPQCLIADAGYFSESNIRYLENEGIDPYVATGRVKHGEKDPAPRGRIPASATVKDRMRRKLRTLRGRSTYRKRKQVVEPVFGQIKQARGLRGFLLRGLDKVTAEWDLICATHNLLKLFRAGWNPKKV
jgi:transposase